MNEAYEKRWRWNMRVGDNTYEINYSMKLDVNVDGTIVTAPVVQTDYEAVADTIVSRLRYTIGYNPGKKFRKELVEEAKKYIPEYIHFGA